MRPDVSARRFGCHIGPCSAVPDASRRGPGISRPCVGCARRRGWAGSARCRPSRWPRRHGSQRPACCALRHRRAESRRVTRARSGGPTRPYRLDAQGDAPHSDWLGSALAPPSAGAGRPAPERAKGRRESSRLPFRRRAEEVPTSADISPGTRRSPTPAGVMIRRPNRVRLTALHRHRPLLREPVGHDPLVV